jgi:hypothetical protein
MAVSFLWLKEGAMPPFISIDGDPRKRTQDELRKIPGRSHTRGREFGAGDDRDAVLQSSCAAS